MPRNLLPGLAIASPVMLPVVAAGPPSPAPVAAGTCAERPETDYYACFDDGDAAGWTLPGLRPVIAQAGCDQEPDPALCAVDVGTQPMVCWWSQHDTRSSDVKLVQVSVNGGAFRTVYDARQDLSQAFDIPVVYQVCRYVGAPITYQPMDPGYVPLTAPVRFVFQAAPANGNRGYGWGIDEVEFRNGNVHHCVIVAIAEACA